MDRLTGRYETGVVHVPQGMMPDALERLAAYEDTGLTPEEVSDLLAIHRGMEGNEYVILDDELRSILFAKNEGRLVVLPCKVGDAVWFIRPLDLKKEITETTVEKIVAKGKGLYIKLACNAMYETSCNSIGKTVFLTREEAEAALKGEGNG